MKLDPNALHGLPASETLEDERARLRMWALLRWENEGGAADEPPPSRAPGSPASRGAPKLTDAEMVQLRIRVIALENLLIALLAEAPQWQLERVQAMAAHISPRPGFTLHPVTLAAATEMRSLVSRARPFRARPRGDRRSKAVQAPPIKGSLP